MIFYIYYNTCDFRYSENTCISTNILDKKKGGGGGRHIGYKLIIFNFTYIIHFNSAFPKMEICMTGQIINIDDFHLLS